MLRGVADAKKKNTVEGGRKKIGDQDWGERWREGKTAMNISRGTPSGKKGDEGGGSWRKTPKAA